MDKDTYIAQEGLRLTHLILSILILAGTAVTLLLSLLDYVVTPDNFSRFLRYRVTASVLLLLLLVALQLKRYNRPFQSLVMVISILIPSVMVESMIFFFGGHQSPYYAGMIIVFIFLLGFLPASFRLTLFLTSMVYSIYLIPLLLFDEISNARIFISNNVFLMGAAFAGLAWRYFNGALLARKLSLEYDLSQDKEQLKRYSTKLEDLVEERTRELNKSELMLRSLFENANDGIVIMDRDGVILTINQKACEIHGFEKEALVGVNIALLETEENKEKFKEREAKILNGESMLFETQHYRKDGSRVSLEISAKAIEVEGTLLIQSFHRDITDRKRLQEQLFQSQKMESIGVLAGGIAHDFNNILSAILGHAELLYEFGNLDTAAKQKVKIIENSSRKAGQMISKLLSFARKGSFESVPLNLNDVIRDTIDLLERMMSKKNIAVKLEMDEKIPSISGDSNQLEHVLMNLVVNAGDAMPDGGTIAIATSVADLERNVRTVHPLLSPGKYVLMTVSDSGTGIPDNIKDKVFDPFFTTKLTGKGTGLGLAMVYGIVKDHGGVINLKSQSGKGTTFEIYIPASGKIIPRVERVALYAITGREKVLVIDDEEDIVSFIKDVLETQGYRVLTADNPVHALDIFRKVGEDIDLVITDIVMPLLNGRELLRQIREIKPKIRTIAISGYDIWNIGRKDKDIDAYIRKPFEGIYLLSIVRRVLDSAGSPSGSRKMPL